MLNKFSHLVCGKQLGEYLVCDGNGAYWGAQCKTDLCAIQVAFCCFRSDLLGRRFCMCPLNSLRKYCSNTLSAALHFVCNKSPQLWIHFYHKVQSIQQRIKHRSNVSQRNSKPHAKPPVNLHELKQQKAIWNVTYGRLVFHWALQSLSSNLDHDLQ